jgi:poly(beta-D-mannuronate) lyase
MRHCRLRVFSLARGLAACSMPGRWHSMTGAPDMALEAPTAQTLAAARVKDPNASFLDVAARRAQLAGDLPPRIRTALPPREGCAANAAPTPPTGAMEIPRRYLAPPPGRGPLNPEQAKRAAPYWQLEDFVADASTRYAVHGEPSTARCLLAALDAWARAETLLNYDPKAWSQSWYTVEWTATSIALAVSIIRAEPALDQASLQRVTAWLDRVARKQLSHTAIMGGSQNNHAYWRGLMATATGIVAADDELFRQGLSLYASGIEHIAEDGSFPLEMQRGELALHYQNFAIMPLMATAELARRQGIDLHRYSANGRTLETAVRLMLSALEDPAVIRKHQAMAQDEVATEDLAWMEWAALRWRDPRLTKHLTQPMFHRRLGGGLTALVASTSPAH